MPGKDLESLNAYKLSWKNIYNSSSTLLKIIKEFYTYNMNVP